MAELLKGAPVAQAINTQVAEEINHLAQKGVLPKLAIVRVGEKPDDIAYERGAMKRCEKVGVAVQQVVLPHTVTQNELLHALQELNQNNGVHGILLLRPLPQTINEEVVRNAVAPHKDVDGITDLSLAGVFAGTQTGFAPCTAQACMEILHHYGIPLQGKRAVVVGRSLVVGRPAAMLLMAQNATVTLCHTRTVDMPAVCREAEILLVSAGRAGIVDKEYMAPGQVVLDVGINVDEEGNLKGDVNLDDAMQTVAAVTPVPGGVGTVTTSVLVKHVVQAAMQTLQ